MGGTGHSSLESCFSFSRMISLCEEGASMPPAKGAPSDGATAQRTPPLELSSQLVAIITTEHYTLQTRRSITIAEANGRASLFVGAVSSGLVALDFVGPLSYLGTAFFVFSLVVLPTLFFMGVITFERCCNRAQPMSSMRRHQPHSPPLPGIRPADAALLFSQPTERVTAEGRAPLVRQKDSPTSPCIQTDELFVKSTTIGSHLCVCLP
jgi:hypothetical protein